jgi:Ca-activated chloride channel family protein
MQPRSGEAAVEAALVVKGLVSGDQSSASTAEQVVHIGDVTFLLRHGGVWTDTRYDETRMRAETVVFGSERYFALLRQSPELGRFLALGDRVVIVLGTKAVQIVPS